MGGAGSVLRIVSWAGTEQLKLHNTEIGGWYIAEGVISGKKSDYSVADFELELEPHAKVYSILEKDRSVEMVNMTKPVNLEAHDDAVQMNVAIIGTTDNISIRAIYNIHPYVLCK